jgi:BMFP domain-containing protein YqiC
MGLAQSAGEEAKAALRAQADRMATELDLVRRDEFEALKTALLAEIAALRAELAQSKGSKRAARPADDAG